MFIRDILIWKWYSIVSWNYRVGSKSQGSFSRFLQVWKFDFPFFRVPRYRNCDYSGSSQPIYYIFFANSSIYPRGVRLRIVCNSGKKCYRGVESPFANASPRLLRRRYVVEAMAYRCNMGWLPTTYRYNMVYPRRTGTSWVRRRATMYRYNVGRPMLYRNLSTMYRYNMGRKTDDF